MNCDVFLQWMKTHAGQGMPENPEVIDHLESCPACRQLFSLDVCLESAIQQAFTPLNLPAGLAETIEDCLDQFNHSHSPMDLSRHAQSPPVKATDPFFQKSDTKKTARMKKSIQKQLRH